jgi:hypothetical protein
MNFETAPIFLRQCGIQSEGDRGGPSTENPFPRSEDLERELEVIAKRHRVLTE